MDNSLTDDVDGSILRGVGAIETIAIKDGNLLNLQAHIDRMKNAFAFFEMECDHQLAEEIMLDGVTLFKHRHKEGLLRIYLPQSNGIVKPHYRFTSSPIPNCRPALEIKFIQLPYLPQYNFKSMSRLVYYVNQDDSTILFIDERGFLCESATHSILLAKGAFLFTPAVPALASPSTAIQGLRNQGFQIYDSFIKREDLNSYDWVMLINSGSYTILYDRLDWVERELIPSLSIFKH